MHEHERPVGSESGFGETSFFEEMGRQRFWSRHLLDHTLCVCTSSLVLRALVMATCSWGTKIVHSGAVSISCVSCPSFPDEDQLYAAVNSWLAAVLHRSIVTFGICCLFCSAYCNDGPLWATLSINISLICYSLILITVENNNKFCRLLLYSTLLLLFIVLFLSGFTGLLNDILSPFIIQTGYKQHNSVLRVSAYTLEACWTLQPRGSRVTWGATPSRVAWNAHGALGAWWSWLSWLSFYALTGFASGRENDSLQ